MKTLSLLSVARVSTLLAWLSAPLSCAWAQDSPLTLTASPSNPISVSSDIVLEADMQPGVEGTVTFSIPGRTLGAVPVDLIFSAGNCPPPGSDASAGTNASSNRAASRSAATASAGGSGGCGGSSSGTAILTLPAGTLAAGQYTVSAALVDINSLRRGGASIDLVIGGGTSLLPPPPTSPTPVTNFEYDAEGHPTKTVVAPNTTGMAFTTTHHFDALGRRDMTTDAKSGVIQFSYDGQDRLTLVIDPRNFSTQYLLDGLGNQSALVSPDTGTTTNTFDAAGNIKTTTDARGVLATFSYDALNRQSQVVYSQSGGANRVINWIYDQTGTGFGYGLGKLTTATSPDASTSLGYDALGRTIISTQSSPSIPSAVALTASFGYDAAGHVTSLSYPSGRVVSFAWANGQPQSVSVTANGSSQVLLDQVVMSPFGPVQSWVWELGGTPRPHQRIYDASGRTVRHPLGTLVRDITYDDAGRIIRFTHYDAVTGLAAPTYDQAFSYDALDRLQTVTATTNWSYTYDANGNRAASAAGTSARGYNVSPTSNRLDGLTSPVRSMGYDAVGNTLSDVQIASGANYSGTYSLEGRLAAMAQGTSIGVDFGYDAFGRRISRSQWTGSPTGTRVVTLYVYDQANHLIGEYKSDGSLITEYVWFGETPVAVIKPDPANSAAVVVYAIHTDNLDTPRVILDAQGNVRWRWLGEPFGATLAEEQPTAGLDALQQNLRFPGQQYETFGGRHYNFFRDYDPTTGRYVQSDPIGLDGGINTYAYVDGNPISFFDPNGLVKHTTGRTIECGKGCTIRIDYTFDERTGTKRRHLHWECKGREGTCGENGESSHGESWEDAPEEIKQCALRHGFSGSNAAVPPATAAGAPEPNAMVPSDSTWSNPFAPPLVYDPRQDRMVPAPTKKGPIFGPLPGPGGFPVPN